MEFVYALLLFYPGAKGPVVIYNIATQNDCYAAANDAARQNYDVTYRCVKQYPFKS